MSQVGVRQILGGTGQGPAWTVWPGEGETGRAEAGPRAVVGRRVAPGLKPRGYNGAKPACAGSRAREGGLRFTVSGFATRNHEPRPFMAGRPAGRIRSTLRRAPPSSQLPKL